MRFFCIFFLLVYVSLGKTNVELELEPLSISLEGAFIQNDTMICFGDYGTFLISYNSGIDWEQKKIFKKGRIVKVFLKDTNFIFFNSNGEIAILKTDLSNIQIDKSNELESLDSITAIIDFPNGFFVRTKTKMYLLNDSLNPDYTISVNSKVLESAKYFAYRNSLTYKDNLLYAELDSLKFLRININNFFADTLNLFNIIESNYALSRYNLLSDSEFVYFQIYDTLFKTKNFKTFEKFYIPDEDDTILHTIFSEFDNKIFALKFQVYSDVYRYRFKYKLFQKIDNKPILVAKQECIYGETLKLSNFIFDKEKIILTSRSKSFAVNNLKDTIIHILCIGIGQRNMNCPYLLKDSTFLYLYKEDTGLWGPPFHQTSDNKGFLFKYNRPFLSTLDSELTQFNDIQHKLFDSSENKIYMTMGTTSILDPVIRKCAIFNIENSSYMTKPLPEYKFSRFVWNNTPNTPNIIKRGNKLITYYLKIDWGINYVRPVILTYTDEFDFLDSYEDSAMVINYLIDWEDYNSFTFLYYDYFEKISKIKSTTNRGASWTIHKTYNKADSMFYFQELVLNDKQYFCAVYFNLADSIAQIDLMDIETKQVIELYKWKSVKPKYHNLLDCAICAENDTLCLAVMDTVYYITDITNKEGWKSIFLPNNGKLKRTLQKYGERYYGRYSDDETEENIYWFTMKTIIPKPLPVISSEDCSFDSVQINSNSKVTKNIKIYNQSEESDLLIYGFSQLTDSAFTNDYIWNDTLTNITVKPLNYFELPVSFKPTEVRNYFDSLIVFSNALENDSIVFLVGFGIDTVTSVVEFSVEKANYLYIFPPYPNPSSEKVNFLIYFDGIFDMDKVHIFDIYGNDVMNTRDLEINPHSKNSNILTWNLSNISNGVYLMFINHGTEKRIAKIMVRR